ncbi:MAG TPA: carboxypeptidase-like regulatory domain-containing protein [Longimicrobium sp.]|nr:carboxypeptidase-like regulatory domain-containing protein [Longimicrobium sp.]
MPRRLLASALLAAAVFAAAELPAQGVRATVTDVAGAPVDGALVRLESETGRLVQAGFTDARGAVRLQHRDPGRYVLSAERSGYDRTQATLLLRIDADTPVSLRMPASPLTLDTLRVATEATGPEVGAETFRRRRSSGRGIYLDSAYVAQRNAVWPGDFLQSVPGIEVRVTSGRGGYRRPTTRMGGRCLTTLVNGLPYYGGWPRFMTLEQTMHASNVVAVEVYRVYEDVPAELRRYARGMRSCGLVVYWTEDGWQSTSLGVEGS